MIMRQFEAAADPARELTKFLQEKRNAAPYVLFMCRVTINNSSSNTFTMVEDVSHMKATKDLRKRGEKTILVKTSATVLSTEANEYKQVIEMDSTIKEYRKLYSSDLAKRLQLNDPRLPDSLSIPALLNPLFGLKNQIVGSGLMSESQYCAARNHLLNDMQDILDRKQPPAADDDGEDEAGKKAAHGFGGSDSDSSDSSSSSSDSSSSEDEVIPPQVNVNYNRVVEELDILEGYKQKKYRPKFDKDKSKVLSNVTWDDAQEEYKSYKIVVGPVRKRGQNLPSKKNLADYVDKNGRFDELAFFADHQKDLPTLYMIAQKKASVQVVEVGCERFFNLSGYISSPKRTSLGVRTYERLAMLSSLIQNVHVNEERIAEEYLRRCSNGSWKRSNTEDALKCWNLERIITSDLMNVPQPEPLTYTDFVSGDNSDCD